MAIEVEHKFSVNSETRDKLVAIGAVRKGFHSFKDVYYDTPVHSLTFQDYWLRKRNGVWQLKSPLKSHPSKPLTDQYKETETEDEILKLLQASEILSEEAPSLDQLVIDRGLSPIAEFTTTRETWLLEDPREEGMSGMNVVLDSTNSGYEIGEAEVMVESTALVPTAEKIVRDLAERIGVCLLSAVE